MLGVGVRRRSATGGVAASRAVGAAGSARRSPYRRSAPRRHSGSAARAAAGSGARQPRPRRKDKVVFHVGMLGEGVDSLNPFLGFQAPSYEMWGLTYDYLTGYTMKDMSPAPGLATKWTTSPDGKTWTFTVRSGVKFSDGVPLTAADVAYTYNRILHGTVEQSNWLSYLTGRHQGDRARRHHRRAEAEEAERDAAAAADPDRARARLEERQREGDQDLQGRADRRQAGRGLRTVPAGAGHRRRLAPSSSRPTPTTGAARPTSTRSTSSSTRTTTPRCRP